MMLLNKYRDRWCHHIPLMTSSARWDQVIIWRSKSELTFPEGWAKRSTVSSIVVVVALKFPDWCIGHFTYQNRRQISSLFAWYFEFFRLFLGYWNLVLPYHLEPWTICSLGRHICSVNQCSSNYLLWWTGIFFSQCAIFVSSNIKPTII